MGAGLNTDPRSAGEEAPACHSLFDIPTPSLVVDRKFLEKNLGRMAHLVDKAGLSLRPHAKAHKCPEIALRQIEMGAIGICCQTVREVEEFAKAGIKNILLTNQIAHPNSAARLARIDRKVTVGIAVDHPFQVSILSEATEIHGRKFDIYIEIEVGCQRCGVESARETIALIQMIQNSPNLKFAGLQAYNGKTQHIYDPLKRSIEVKATARRTLEFIKAIKGRGFEIPVITGGGTGSLEQDICDNVLTELQCGSYALMDADYQSLGFSGHAEKFRFETALGVAARVISKRGDDYAVIDAGLKAFSFDSGNPIVQSHPGLFYSNPSDEHGIIISREGSPLPEVGEILVLIPGHCDPTVALYRAMNIYLNKRIEMRWPIVAQGN